MHLHPVYPHAGLVRDDLRRVLYAARRHALNKTKELSPLRSRQRTMAEIELEALKRGIERILVLLDCRNF